MRFLRPPLELCRMVFERNVTALIIFSFFFWPETLTSTNLEMGSRAEPSLGARNIPFYTSRNLAPKPNELDAVLCVHFSFSEGNDRGGKCAVSGRDKLRPRSARRAARSPGAQP